MKKKIVTVLLATVQVVVLMQHLIQQVQQKPQTRLIAQMKLQMLLMQRQQMQKMIRQRQMKLQL